MGKDNTEMPGHTGATLKMSQKVMFLSMNHSFTLYQILKLGKSKELTQTDAE